MTCDDSGIHLGEVLSIEFSDPALLFLRCDEEKERGSEVTGRSLFDLSDRLLPRCDKDPVGLIVVRGGGKPRDRENLLQLLLLHRTIT